MLVTLREPPMPTNRILNSLSPVDLDCMRPFLEFVSLRERAVLQEPHRRIQSVDFVESGIVSVTRLAAGDVVELATVDSRGVVGLSVALGARVSVYRSVVLVPGTALRIGAEELQRCMDERPQIRDTLLQYVHSFMIHSAQTAVCRARHGLEESLASWLCLVCDSLGDSALAITHDQLSMVLGSRRASITKALIRFEEHGLIQKQRGVLQVRDPGLLRQKACCCYGTISDAYRRKNSQPLVYK
jgi:CRP-like cAMP-binding protein